MARIRSAKPEWWKKEKWCALSRDVRFTYKGIWEVMCDDDGRFQADSRLIKSAVWPLDDDITVKKIDRWLEQIAQVEVTDASGKAWPAIVLYEVAGVRYGWLPGFAKHQKISHATPSKLPPPPSNERRDSGAPPESRQKPAGAPPEVLRPDVDLDRDVDVDLEEKTTTTTRARVDFGDVARALDDSPHPHLLDRFATLVSGSPATYFGYCRRALGMGAKGLSPPELADVVAQYLANLDTGSELTLNAGRFDAYLKRSIRERREGEMRAANGPRPPGRSSPGAEAVERQERVRSTALAVAEAVIAARRTGP